MKKIILRNNLNKINFLDSCFKNHKINCLNSIKYFSLNNEYNKQTKNSDQTKNKQNKKTNTNYKIDFHLENLEDIKEKKIIEQLIKQKLKDHDISADKAEEFKQEVRGSTFGFKFNNIHRHWDPTFFDVDKGYDMWDEIFSERLFLKYVNLVNFQREQRKELFDLRYQEIKQLGVKNKINNDIYPMTLNDTKNKQGRRWKPHLDVSSPNFDSEEFNTKQKRFDLNYNYNFEEFKLYTETFKESKKIDNEKTNQEEKVMKFLRNKSVNGLENSPAVQHWLKKLTLPIEKYKINENVNIEDFELPIDKRYRRQAKKKYTEDISNYETWRIFDREVPMRCNLMDNSKVIKLIPAKLKKRFLDPESPFDMNSSGHYCFSDVNMDIFMLYEYKQTTYTYGPNYPDDVYERQKLEKIKPSRHLLKALSMEEFWNSEEPMEFRILFTRYAEWKKFACSIREEVSFLSL